MGKTRGRVGAEMSDLSNSFLSGILGGGGSEGVASLLKEEVEEAISPVTSRVDRLEKKIDLLILAVERVEKLLVTIQPIVKLFNNLPFIK